MSFLKRLTPISLIVALVALTVIAVGGTTVASGSSKASAGSGAQAQAARRRGRRGPRGRRGARGPRGFTGAQGPAGPTGPSGGSGGTGGVAPFNAIATGVGSINLYNAHGLSVTANCQGTPEVQFVTFRGSAENGAMSVGGTGFPAGNAATASFFGDPNLDNGENVIAQGGQVEWTASYLGADGANASFIFATADQGGNTAGATQPAEGNNTPGTKPAGACALWGTRQLG